VRVLHEDRTGYAYSDDLSIESLLEAASVASYVASASNPVTVANLTKQRARPFETIALPAAEVNTGRKVNLLIRADDTARAFDGRVNDVSCNYADSLKSIAVINSEGLWIENDEQLFRMMVSVTVIEDGLRDSGLEFLGGRYGFDYFDSHTPEEAARKAVQQALTKLHARPAPAGQFPVIVEAGWG
jgi:TldD protein